MLKYLRLILLVGPRILFTFLFFINRYAKNPNKYPFELRYKRVRRLIIKVLEGFRIDYKVTNMAPYNAYDDKCVLVSNHLSDSDPLIYIALSEKPVTFVAKKETFEYPFIAKCLKAIEAIPLDRENIRNQITSLNKAIETAKNGIPNVIIFAEGTRNRNPGTPTLEFKPGSFKVAQRAEVALFPISIYGSFRVFKGKINLKKYPVFVDFLDPIMPNELLEMKTTDLAIDLRNKVDEHINKNKPLDKKAIENLKISTKRKLALTQCDLI